MQHSLNGTRLVSGLLRATEVTVLTVGTLPPRQYTTIASRCLFLAESIGFQASGRSYNMFVRMWYSRDTDRTPRPVRWALLVLRVAPSGDFKNKTVAHAERHFQLACCSRAAQGSRHHLESLIELGSLVQPLLL
jgi:hypothetical protein